MESIFFCYINIKQNYENMDYLRSYNPQVNELLSPLENSTVSALLRLCLVLYAGLAAPHLPNNILKLFDYVPFQLLIMFLIAWTANHDPVVSLLIAVGFFVTLNALAGKKYFENFQPTSVQQ